MKNENENLINEDKNIKTTIPNKISEEKDEKKKEDEILDNLEQKIDSPHSEEVELKDHYSIDDISFSEFIKNDEDENSLLYNSKKKIKKLMISIFEDNLENFKNILSNKKSLINKKTFEGFSFIQYAALNGSINCFKYLISLKVVTDEDIEGFHLIHLSLINCLFIKYKKKCIDIFNYIYHNLPEQKYLVDRLGRTYLHLIFEYNLEEALNYVNIQIEDLFVEDNNGDYAINYIYLYNAENCFWKVAKDPNFLRDIYITVRQKYKSNESVHFSREEKFMENLFLYQNYKIIATIIINCRSFSSEIIKDLHKLLNNYSQLINDESINIERKDIENMLGNITYIMQYLQFISMNKNIENNIQFKFPYIKPICKTAIIYNKDCINHIKLPENDIIKHMKHRKRLFENSDRLSCLINEENGIILNDQIFNCRNENLKDNKSFFDPKFIVLESQRKSCLNDILKCHDIKYIKALKYKSDNIKKNINNHNINKNKNETSHFWDNIDLDLIEHNYFLYNDNKDTSEESNDLYKYEKIDIDTFINQYSYENIFNTSGCVFDAIDIVMESQAINSFAIIRPPGHHSGYYGPVENEFGPSNGFCIVNNVAIGAAYAKYKYKDSIQKIAIVDIDVHHGNGTEEIIQMLNYKNFSKPFKYEKICGVKIMDKQNINWLDFDDAKNILFISTHIYNKESPDKFYPYSGSDEKNTKKDEEIYPGGIYNIPLEFKENYPYEYKNILRSKIIPRLYKFKPNIIFVSAGFDGHKLETINQNHMLLQEDDYGYIAKQLQFVANKFCEGRMISILEGGYNVNTGVISSFAQSVFKYTRYLNIGANVLQCTDVKLSSHKRKIELKEEIDLYNLVDKASKKPRRSERLKQMEEKSIKEDIKEQNKDEIKDNSKINENTNNNINSKINDNINNDFNNEINTNIIYNHNTDNNNNLDNNICNKDNKNNINNNDIKNLENKNDLNNNSVNNN